MKNTYLIGITGGSGSGKTTFIRRLREQFSEQEVCIISQDDYYRPIHEQKKDKEGVINFDRPNSIDKEAFVRNVQQLMNGKEVRIVEYTFNNSKKKPKEIILKPAPIIIVEGLFVFHFKKIRKQLDLKVYVHAKENLKIIRRIQRDQIERNYPLDDVLYRYKNHVLPAFDRYIAPYIDKADIVINNNTHFKNGLKMMICFIRQRLNK